MFLAVCRIREGAAEWKKTAEGEGKALDRADAHEARNWRGVGGGRILGAPYFGAWSFLNLPFVTVGTFPFFFTFSHLGEAPWFFLFALMGYMGVGNPMILHWVPLGLLFF